MKRIFEVNPWKVITHTFNKEDKRLQESMTSTGNEYMGMRGMFEEKYTSARLSTRSILSALTSSLTENRLIWPKMNSAILNLRLT